jgi:CheY-like chemotaxis protein
MGLLVSLADARAGGSRPRRLLVADGDATVAMVLVDMLRVLGYPAVGFTDADAALEHCATQPLDGVITELGLLCRDGTSLIDVLTATYSDLPVAVLTGWLDHPECRSGQLEPVGLVVAKPLLLADLDAVVTALLAGVRLRLHPALPASRTG